MLLSYALAATALVVPALSQTIEGGAPPARPNVVLVLVDDQDARQDSISSMNKVQELLVKEGTQFSHFYAPISVCCPSRSSLLRAQAAHNTNITNVIAPYGGWKVFNEKGYNGHYLPSFLQEAGYGTYYVGKLMNDHSVANFDTLPPQGWTAADFLIDPNTYNYWNASFSRDSHPVEYHPDEYSTDVVHKKALGLIEEAAKQPEPFFIGIAPIAPHSHIGGIDHANGIPTLFDLPRSAPRHDHLFKDVTLNYSRASHNPDVPSGASWVRRLEKLNVTNVDYIEEFYRQRLRALQAVDELVEGVVRKLEEVGQLDNTIIIYTSDNGFDANGGHRRQPGKTLPYEEDINVPLVVRGPSVPKGLLDTSSVYSLADLGATILHLAGAESDYEHDGAVVPLTTELREKTVAKQHHLAEYWVQGVGEGKFAQGVAFTNQTYRAIRVVEESAGIDYYYAVWCTGEKEIHDMTIDPDQMNNLYLTAPTLNAKLQSRLDALLLILKSCVGDVCNNPWRYIFPNKGIETLAQALDEEFDEYFEALPRVKYERCEFGFHRQLEKPFWHGDLAFDKRAFALGGGSPAFVVQA